MKLLNLNDLYSYYFIFKCKLLLLDYFIMECKQSLLFLCL